MVCYIPALKCGVFLSVERYEKPQFFSFAPRFIAHFRLETIVSEAYGVPGIPFLCKSSPSNLYPLVIAKERYFRIIIFRSFEYNMRINITKILGACYKTRGL